MVVVQNTLDPLAAFVDALRAGPRNVSTLSQDLFASASPLEITFVEQVLESHPDMFRKVGEFWLLSSKLQTA